MLTINCQFFRFPCARSGISVNPFPSRRSFPFSSLACYLRGLRGSSMSVNKVILVGRLGRDPETRYTGGGQAVANFSDATDESYKDKNGEGQKRTSFEIVANNFRMLGGRAEGAAAGAGGGAARSGGDDMESHAAPADDSYSGGGGHAPSGPEISDEDIPF